MPLASSTAHGDRLSALPTELHLLIGEHLDAQSLAKLRVMSRQFAAALYKLFFQKATFHIIVDVQHLADFEDLVARHNKQIRRVELAHRYLLDTYVMAGKRWRGQLGQPGPLLPCLDRRAEEFVEAVITPCNKVVHKFVHHLLQLPNVEAIGTYTEYFQVAMSYAEREWEDGRVFYDILNVREAERSASIKGLCSKTRLALLVSHAYVRHDVQVQYYRDGLDQRTWSFPVPAIVRARISRNTAAKATAQDGNITDTIAQCLGHQPSVFRHELPRAQGHCHRNLRDAFPIASQKYPASSHRWLRSAEH